AKFVEFVVGDAGQKDVTELKYVAATADMKGATVKVAGAMTGQAAAPPTTTLPSTPITAPAGSTIGGGSGTAGGADVAGATAGAGSADSAELAKTGGIRWPLGAVAFVLMIGGEVARRR